MDILFLTETWASAGESSVFEELCPPDCCFISTPRCTGKGGGVAMVFKQSLNIRPVVFGVIHHLSYSVLCWSLISLQCSVRLFIGHLILTVLYTRVL